MGRANGCVRWWYMNASVDNLAVMMRNIVRTGQMLVLRFPTLHHYVSSQRSLWCVRTCSTTTRHGIPVFPEYEKYKDKLAVVTQHGRYTYTDILHYSRNLAKEIKFTISQNQIGTSSTSLHGARIAFLCENDLSYIVTKFAIWRCGGIAMPLCTSHPASELRYFVEDSGAALLVTTDTYRDRAQSAVDGLAVPLKVLTTDDYSGDYETTSEDSANLDGAAQQTAGTENQEVSDESSCHDAMIVYTSGTTGRPKGVVHTHGNIVAQIEGMVSAWGWRASDVNLHVLPLHHVHGITNVLLTALYVGATCVMMPRFDAMSTWKALVSSKSPSVNLFMAVPTIYAKLIEAYDRQGGDITGLCTGELRDILQDKIRCMVSGSAALPEPVMARWEEITGHTLLERYGMTETGMVLTNPLHGHRVPGYVGQPFPSVEVCIAGDDHMVLAKGDNSSTTVTPGMEEQPGELLVKGPSVFPRYWNRPEATRDAFTHDGWFKTGDTALYKDGVYKIVGRTSVDVIKSGGYKISALEIERHLLAHPDICDCAVLGLPDPTWGQVIAAVIVTRVGNPLPLGQLQAWARERMPPYQVPRVIRCLHNMPRNAMGKVNKKELIRTLFPGDNQS